MLPLRVHVFLGGKTGVQHQPLLSARRSFRLAGYYLEWFEVDIDLVKEHNWRPVDLIEWLIDSDIHLIISHLHQGLLDTLRWNVSELKNQLGCLYNHVGFPFQENLFCPVFLQDKFEYIDALGCFCNPTLKVDFNNTERFNNRAQEREWYALRSASVASFMEQHNECNSWVVKSPYTTNCDFRQFCGSHTSILAAINAASERFKHQMSYVMVQPTMLNRREEKVVLLNGKATHIADKSMNPCRGGHKFAEQGQLFEFAEDAVKFLKKLSPSFLCEGLVRVDIFCNAQGRLVVNEFESLEATHYSTNHTVECFVSRILTRYWLTILNRCVQRVLFQKAAGAGRPRNPLRLREGPGDRRDEAGRSSLKSGC